jgi:hypothetical protein
MGKIVQLKEGLEFNQVIKMVKAHLNISHGESFRQDKLA